jgi:hypothetical protein
MLRTSLLLLLSLALVAACGRNDDDRKAAMKVAFDSDSARLPALGPDDVLVTSTDGAVVMAVIGDTVRMQLSDSLRRSVAAELDSSASKEGGLAATITKSVGKVVNSAMGFVVRVPVEDVQNLRYEDGRIRFDVRGGKVNLNTSSNSRNAMFTEEDAKRFIEAVERRQRAKGVAM